MTTYSLAINGGAVTASQSLRVAVLSMVRTNAQPTEVVASWRICPGGSDPAPLAENDSVVIYRNTTVIFRGYVVTVQSGASEQGGQVKAVLRDALEVWRRRYFVRGAWWPAQQYPYGYEPEGPLPEPDWSNFNNSPLCAQWLGYYWNLTELDGNQWDTKAERHQTIPEAIEELIYYGNTAAEHADADENGLVVMGTLSFGETPMQPEVRYLTSPVNCLDWLVGALAPQLDGWARLDFTDEDSTLNAGRYRDVTATTLLDSDILSRASDPRTAEVASGVIFAVAESLAVVPISTTSGAEWSDRSNAPVTLYAEPPTTASLELAAESAMLARPVGSVEVPGDLALSLPPGSRVIAGGVTLNVQRCVWQFGRDRVTLELGSARQLGISDLESIRSWLAKVGGGAL